MSDLPGHFVAFEGGEASGKSTQLEALAACAREAGLEVVTCREPGGTPFGERVREALLGAESPPGAVAELLAFNAARAALVDSVIRPALERGALVLCDRFTDSTLAYQHFGRGLERSLVEAVNEAATRGLQPQLVVLLDLPVTDARARQQASDYLEREELEFHERVRRGYLEQANAQPERWLVLEATEPREVLTAAIWERVAPLIGRA